MASPHVLEFEELLSPLSAENACGENLRYNELFKEIERAAREKNRESDEPIPADWVFVAERSSELLAQRSKDLMIAAYLTVAAVEQHGFAGLRDWLHMVNELITRYWDNLYPELDESLERRAAPLKWLTEADRGGRLPNRIRDIALAPSGNGESLSLTFSRSTYVPPKSEREDAEVYARRQVEAEQRKKVFEETVNATPPGYYANLREDIAECSSEALRLRALVEEKFGEVGPGTTALTDALKECVVVVDGILKSKGGLEEPGNGVAEEQTQGSGATISGPIRSRPEALRRLAEVAAFFRQTEPHSPISYLIDRAASWGHMTLPDLLADLVKDATVRDQIGELLAFRGPEKE